ncbi:MAG: hypothetical protein ACOYBY_11750 [Dermatophilaceae bacterium]
MNYNTATPPVVGGTLAFTGSNSVWLGLAAFALIAAGSAMMRIVPKRRSAQTVTD